MKEQLKRLTSDSAFYGISNVLGRFITFLLVPFYAHTLPQAEYGIVLVVYSYIAFLNAVFTFGLEPAYMRFVAGSDTPRRNRVFSSSLWFIGIASVLFAALIVALGTQVQSVLDIDAGFGGIVPLAVAMVALDAFNIIPFAALRMGQRPRFFAMVKLVSIVINVGLNVLFIGVLRWSVSTVFLSGVIASLSSTLLLLPTILSHGRSGMDRRLLRELLVYGLPTMPGAISIMLIEIIDKPIMQKLTNWSTVAVYGANYKLGIFMMLVVTMFRYAWQPFYLQLASNDDAKRLFARVLTYFVLVGAVIVLTLSVFIGDIVRIPLPGGRSLIPSEYWSGLGIVPIILFSYLWAGIGQILNAGIYIERKTMHVLYATALGAVVNIVSNFLLIPVWGLYGGAFATFAAYFSIAVFYAIAGSRIYPIRYEIGRLLRIGGALAVSALIWYLFPVPAFLPAMVWQSLLIVIFFGLLWASGFFLPQEVVEIRLLLRRVARR
ncbi:MAG: polysaccharide biosynthesis C-terminal domain-containing protein [Bacteroidetes bacterium]|nr:polysaccharide biosynthesis C-terminal domain-containing protein [Bacteroidota bacterium]